MSGEKISFSTKVGATALATIGVSLEWFDFFAYGTAAALVFPHYFFPPRYPYFWALVLSLVTYLVGFVARPVGAIIFGHIGDRYGRKAGLTWDLVLMGLGTLAIGLTPGYQQIGYLGITLVSIFRIFQGLGVGGEWGGATTFVEEFAADSRWRAFWGSWVQQGVPIGLLMAAGLFTLFSSIYRGEAFITFGWKPVFWIGAIVAIIAVILRAIFLETPRFLRLVQRGEVSRAPIPETFKRYWKKIILLAFARGSENANFYVYSEYSLLFFTGLGLARTLVTGAVTIAATVEVFAIIAAALLADIIGRKLVLIGGNAAVTIYAVPYVLLAIMFRTSPNFFLIATLLLVVFAIIHGFMYAAETAYWAELFPTKYRYTATGTAYHLTAVVAGGLSPLIITALVGTQYIARWWGQALVIALYGIISIICFLMLEETKGKELPE